MNLKDKSGERREKRRRNAASLGKLGFEGEKAGKFKGRAYLFFLSRAIWLDFLDLD